MTNAGIYVDGRNPKSKKEIKDRVKNGDLSSVEVYTTSALTAPTVRTLNALPDGDYVFVGPDPYADRKFYGTVEVRAGKVTVK